MERRRADRRALIGYSILVVAVLLAFAGGWKNDREICDSAQENRRVLRSLIQAGDPVNLRPGEAGYEYYRAHPVERRAAHERNQRLLRETVPPIEC